MTNVIAKRMEPVDVEMGKLAAMYYLNDGVYGSFNCTIFDHWVVNPIPFPLNGSLEGREFYMTTLWGPTCDSMDCISRNVIMPEMNIGEWIVFQEMGAYTMAAASNFNGFKTPTIKLYLPAPTVEVLKAFKSWSRIYRLIEDDDEQMDDDDSLIETFYPDNLAINIVA